MEHKIFKNRKKCTICKRSRYMKFMKQNYSIKNLYPKPEYKYWWVCLNVKKCLGK